RTVCGLPLGSTDLLRPAVMINLLGQHIPRMHAAVAHLLAIEGLHLHVYGKAEARRDRKMGHLTILAESVEEALARAQQAWDLVRAPDDPPAVAGARYAGPGARGSRRARAARGACGCATSSA